MAFSGGLRSRPTISLALRENSESVLTAPTLAPIQMQGLRQETTSLDSEQGHLLHGSNKFSALTVFLQYSITPLLHFPMKT